VNQLRLRHPLLRQLCQRLQMMLTLTLRPHLPQMLMQLLHQLCQRLQAMLLILLLILQLQLL
jgi:hypothetical protein